MRSVRWNGSVNKDKRNEHNELIQNEYPLSVKAGIEKRLTNDRYT